MTILRSYQRAALQATYRYWETEGGSPLIEMATGCGKSVVIATLVRELMTRYPHMRILSLVHVRELVEQNAQALLRAWPGAPVGINCAGLGQRDTRHPIICASIQSVARHSRSLGERHLVLVDEAHLLPAHGEGMYHDLLKEMQLTTSPDLRLWGCTATPYRLDSGRLDQGDGRLFDRIVYTYGIGQGIKDKHLSPLVAKTGEVEIDVSNVARRGGEFLPQALGAAADQDGVVKGAVAEIVRLGADRKSWLVFATTVQHAWNVQKEIDRYGIQAQVVSAETPARERASMLSAFKAGTLRALVNVSVLTTGFDAPAIDLIAMLRPTLSTGLYVQMLGRGTRLAPGKTDCLILDYSGNVRRHGPVDDVSTPKNKDSTSTRVSVDDVKAKECLHCKTLNALNAQVCVSCSTPFRFDEPGQKHQAVADMAPVLAMRTPLDWRDVTESRATRHTKFGAPDAPPTLRVTYICGHKEFSEFLCFEHPQDSFPQRKAATWWKEHGGRDPVPSVVTAALARQYELADVEAIRVVKDGEYFRVISRRFKKPLAAAS